MREPSGPPKLAPSVPIHDNFNEIAGDLTKRRWKVAFEVALGAADAFHVVRDGINVLRHALDGQCKSEEPLLGMQGRICEIRNARVWKPAKDMWKPAKDMRP